MGLCSGFLRYRFSQSRGCWLCNSSSKESQTNYALPVLSVARVQHDAAWFSMVLLVLLRARTITNHRRFSTVSYPKDSICFFLGGGCLTDGTLQPLHNCNRGTTQPLYRWNPITIHNVSIVCCLPGHGTAHHDFLMFRRSSVWVKL